MNDRVTGVQTARRESWCWLGAIAVLGLALSPSGAAAADNRAEETAAGAATIKLTGPVREKCLSVLRAAMTSDQADDFWPAVHAAEALTIGGAGREVLANFGPRLEQETDDQRRCGLARELVRAGDYARLSVLLDVLAKDDAHGHTHAAESLFKVGEVGDGRMLRRRFP